MILDCNKSRKLCLIARFKKLPTKKNLSPSKPNNDSLSTRADKDQIDSVPQLIQYVPNSVTLSIEAIRKALLNAEKRKKERLKIIHLETAK